MMDCQRVADYFGVVYEGEADAQTSKMVKDHLESCPACREDFKWYGVTVQALANLEQIAPPNDFVECVNRRIDQSSSPFQSILIQIKNMFNSIPTAPVPVGAASLAFVTFLCFMVYNYTPGDIGPVNLEAQSPAPSSSSGLAPSPAQPQVVASAPFVSRPAPFSHALAPYNGLGAVGASTAAWHFPTVADEIGADNLTVESPQIDLALQTLKNILPGIHGKLIDEQPRGSFGDKLVGVIIPSNRYGDLASALVNHGAVEVGAKSQESESPAPAKVDSQNVRLYIRFTQAPK